MTKEELRKLALDYHSEGKPGYEYAEEQRPEPRHHAFYSRPLSCNAINPSHC